MILKIFGNTLQAWVTAVKFAEKGNLVFMATEDEESYNHQIFKEPGLADAIIEQQTAGRLLSAEVAHPEQSRIDAFLLATELDSTQTVDLLSAVQDSQDAEGVVLMMMPTQIGMLDEYQAGLDQRVSLLAKKPIHVVGLPVFFREGRSLEDFSSPSMVLIGTSSDRAAKFTRELMRPFVSGATQVMEVPPATAEMIVLGVNAMLATRLSFMNEMASLAERVGVDIETVRRGIAADRRIGADYLQPGCGFGGHMFSSFLLNISRSFRKELDSSGLIDRVLEINQGQKEVLFRKLWRHYEGELQGRKVAIWGAAYKPGSASTFNSPIHVLLPALWAQGVRTTVYDPLVGSALLQEYPGQPLLELVEDAYSPLMDADALLILTACDEFQSPDYRRMSSLLKRPVIIDGRNMYDPEYVREQGFEYSALGRGEVF